MSSGKAAHPCHLVVVLLRCWGVEQGVDQTRGPATLSCCCFCCW